MVSITQEPTGSAYHALINLAFRTCSAFILVKRHQLQLDESGINLLSLLGPSLIEVKVESKWPGTELLGHNADVYYFRTDKQAKDALLKFSDRLYVWLAPNLPEDLCFLKDNGEVWLATISHEKESWFTTILDNEMEELGNIPGLYLGF